MLIHVKMFTMLDRLSYFYIEYLTYRLIISAWIVHELPTKHQLGFFVSSDVLSVYEERYLLQQMYYFKLTGIPSSWLVV